MYKNSSPISAGALVSALLLGFLFLAGPLTPSAYGASSCPADLAGTQVYAECAVRESRGGGAETGDFASAPDPAVEETISSTALWQLTLAGVVGVLLGMGALLGGRAAMHHRHAHAAP